MTSTDPWSDPDLNNSGDFYKFDNVGDKASGRITRIGKFKFEGDDRYVPQLQLTDDATGEAMDLTAKQVQLKAKLTELRPNVGDHLAVAYTHDEKIADGRKTKKCFTVVVNASGQPQAAPAAVAQAPVEAPVAASPVAAVVESATDPSAAQAALKNLRINDPTTYALLHPQAAAQA